MLISRESSFVLISCLESTRGRESSLALISRESSFMLISVAGAVEHYATRSPRAAAGDTAVRRLILSCLRLAAERVKRAGAVASMAAASATVAAAHGGSSSAEDGM